MAVGLAAQIARTLQTWLDGQPSPRGSVRTGDTRVRLGAESKWGYSIDVAYFADDVNTGSGDPFVVGVPTLAVEIMSPSTVYGRHDAKIDRYLAAGVPLVWEVSPTWESVRAFTPDRRSKLYNFDDTIGAEGVLPGFSVPVKAFFTA